MATPIEWIEITKFKPIGAVGFLDDKVVAIVAFHDDKDANRDGTVSLGENVIAFVSPIKMDGRNVAEVAMQARVDMAVMMRDPSFGPAAARLFADFATSLTVQGIYAAYFARGVSMLGKGVARKITSGMVKELVLRKGFESAAKSALTGGLGAGR